MMRAACALAAKRCVLLRSPWGIANPAPGELDSAQGSWRLRHVAKKSPKQGVGPGHQSERGRQSRTMLRLRPWGQGGNRGDRDPALQDSANVYVPSVNGVSVPRYFAPGVLSALRQPLAALGSDKAVQRISAVPPLSMTVGQLPP